jgi:hypothetical protein
MAVSFRRKIQQRVVGGWEEEEEWGNSSSKAFGISFADRPKAKKRFMLRTKTT